jgi:uncharacterized protein DUF6958
MSATPERVRLRNPDKTKGGPSIDREKYEIVRKAILSLVPKTSPGITWTSLRDAADKRLGRKLEGSNNWWYTTAVKLHLEAIGELQRSKGSPQRLTRTE